MEDVHYDEVDAGVTRVSQGVFARDGGESAENTGHFAGDPAIPEKTIGEQRGEFVRCSFP